MTSMAPRCPTCKREVLMPGENSTFPFCTERCRTIDLGRWMGGEYRIAVTSVDEDEDGDVPPVEPTDA